MDIVSADFHAHIDDDTYLCCPIPTAGQDTSALINHRLDRLQELSQKNFHLAIMCLVYIGVNVVCLIINSMGKDFVDQHEHTFHLLEFWATFIFSCVQVYSLVFSPRSLGAVYSNPLVLKVVVFFNVVATFISALLISVSLEAFEAVAHEMEYANEITMSFVDVVLLAVVSKQFGYDLQSSGFTLLTTVFALFVAIIQLGVYNILEGYKGGFGEVLAHYFEFGFEILSAFISFSFCMDNKFLCDLKIREVLFSRQKMHVRVGQSCTSGKPCASAAKCSAGLVCTEGCRAGA